MKKPHRISHSGLFCSANSEPKITVTGKTTRSATYSPSYRRRSCTAASPAGRQRNEESVQQAVGDRSALARQQRRQPVAEAEEADGLKEIHHHQHQRAIAILRRPDVAKAAARRRALGIVNRARREVRGHHAAAPLHIRIQPGLAHSTAAAPASAATPAAPCAPAKSPAKPARRRSPRSASRSGPKSSAAPATRHQRHRRHRQELHEEREGESPSAQMRGHPVR